MADGKWLHGTERDRLRDNADGPRVCRQRQVADDPKLPAMDWSKVALRSVVGGGIRRDFQVRQRLTELRELLLDLGFNGIELFGALDAETPYDHTAERLVAIARAPQTGPHAPGGIP